MAEVNVLESLVNDLLSRVQKLEDTDNNKNYTEIQKYLGTLDHVSFSMTVAIDVLSKVLIDKGLVTKEDLTKSLETEREKIATEIQSRTNQTKNQTE